MINKLEKANTEEVTTLFSGKYGFTCAMRYVARKDIKEYYIEIFKMAQEAIALAPAFGCITKQMNYLITNYKKLNDIN